MGKCQFVGSYFLEHLGILKNDGHGGVRRVEHCLVISRSHCLMPLLGLLLGPTLLTPPVSLGIMRTLDYGHVDNVNGDP